MKKTVVAITALLTLVLCFDASLYAGPTYGGWGRTSVGVRFGWNGGPNGLTLRREFASGHAFEALAGYNGKHARHADIPALRKGNSFIGVSYAPFLRPQGDYGVALNADFGARLNYHHYRIIGYPGGGWKITPEVTAGLGIQVDLAETIEVFADLHVKYFSDPHNYYLIGMESGLGVRVVLN